MQKALSFFSAFVLLSFLALITLKIDAKIVDHNTASLEEVDLEDILEDETEEVEFQVRDLFPLAFENSFSKDNQTITFNYQFAIKPNLKEVHSPPPEA